MARYKFQFWLDASKDDEILVAEQIDELKRKRNFSSVVRDGIMIVSELRAGRVDLLLQLYPWIADAIRPPTPPSDLDQLQKKLDRMERLLLERGGEDIPSAPPSYPTLKPVVSGLQPVVPTGKTLSSPKFSAPIDDDDDDMLVLKKDTRTDAGLNFLASMSALTQ